MVGQARTLLGGPVLVPLVELGRRGVAGVEEDSVFEGEGFAVFEFQVAGALGGVLWVVVVEAEDVGGVEAVLAGVPAGGVAGVGGVVEDRDPVGFAADRAGGV